MFHQPKKGCCLSPSWPGLQRLGNLLQLRNMVLFDKNFYLERFPSTVTSITSKDHDCYHCETENRLNQKGKIGNGLRWKTDLHWNAFLSVAYG